MRCAAGAACAVLAVGWAATLSVGPWSDESVNDLFVYRSFAAPVLEGAIPYRDVFLEYPPLAAPAIAAPGLLGTGEEVFRLAFAGWTLALAGAVLVLCGALARRTGGDRTRAMLAVACAPLLLGAMVRTHFDLAPVALTLGALLLLVSGRPRAGMAVLGLGVMTKGFPLVVAPVALAWLTATNGRRAAFESTAAMATVSLALVALAVAASPSGAVDALTYQGDRPVQLESTPASVLLVLDGLGLGQARSVKSHRSDGLVHPADDVISAISVGSVAALVAILCLLAARGPGEPRRLVLASLAAVAAFACLGRILSPQFLIWLVPLGALALAWGLNALAAAVAAAAVLTQVEFPARYFDVVDREPGAIALVCVRNAVLIAVLALAVRVLNGPVLMRSAIALRSSP